MSAPRWAYLPATEIARRIASGELASADVVGEVMDRIRASQPAINAFITVADETALRDARAADEARAAGKPLGPLHGVPVSVKDIINVAGMKMTFGSLLLADSIAQDDAVSVRRLREAGAIIIGKTTSPEFAHKLLTDAPLFGVTRNPWALDKTPGGSSGGASAAVAAGLGPLALATDAGASTRLPAACCGIVGLKPTLGLLPHNQVPDGFGNFIHLGILARTVADTALMLGVLAGADASDPFSMAVPRRTYAPASIPSGARIAWRPLVGNELLAAEVRAACESALADLAGEGAVIETLDDEIENPEPTWRILQQSNWAARFEQDAKDNADRMDPSLIEGIKEGLTYTGRDVQRAMYRRTRFHRQVQSWFTDRDFVVTPTISRPPLDAEHKASEPIEIDGNPAGDMRQTWCPYLNLFNLSGNPAISVPCGWTEDGLPIGIQIVGPWYAEEAVLGLAAVLERTRPWAHRTPPEFAAA